MREAIAPVSITRSRESDAHTGPASWHGGVGAVSPELRRTWMTAATVRVALLVVAAVVLAWALREIGDQPVVYDANGYVVHAQILANGPIEVWGFRTYGYPAFLVPWVVLAGRDQDLLRWCVFVAQVAVHLAASWLFARRVAGAFGEEGLGRLTFALVVLNPFLLLMTSPLLSDLLSAALSAVGIGLLLPTRNDRPAVVIRDGMLALFALTLAVEVRPANAVLLPVCTALWTIRWWMTARRELMRFVGGLVLVGAVAALPLVPQSVINWRAHGNPTPLLVTSLYEQQMTWGVQNLKYATFVLARHPGLSAVFYANPFSSGQASIAGLAQANPLGLVATLALHGFALFDQDYPFPYVRELDSWLRWPLSVTGYLFLWAASVGLVVGWRRWWRPGTRLAWSILPVASAAYILVYLPTAVECRFGLPLFVLLAPAAAMTLLAVGARARARDWRRLAVTGASALLTIAACAWVSVWVQAQAPEIAVTREIVQGPGSFLPVARFDARPPERWTTEQRQTYVLRAANVGERAWSITPPGKVFLRVRFVGPGDAETVDTRVEIRPPIEAEVPPGGQLEMNVTVSAPRKEGAYRLRQWLEIEEHPGLFAGQPYETPVTVDERRGGRR